MKVRTCLFKVFKATCLSNMCIEIIMEQNHIIER